MNLLLLLLLFCALPKFGPPILEPNLYASRVQFGLIRQLLAPMNIWVVGSVEGGLQFCQLGRRERGSVPFGAHRIEKRQLVVGLGDVMLIEGSIEMRLLHEPTRVPTCLILLGISIPFIIIIIIIFVIRVLIVSISVLIVAIKNMMVVFDLRLIN